MKDGFTLVELSIVLVVIGLLIGGVLIGQTLVTSARNTKIISMEKQYEVMIKQFQSRTKCLPGDCNKSFIPPSISPEASSHDFRGDGNSSISNRYESAAVLGHLQVVNLFNSGFPMDFFRTDCDHYETDTIDCYLKGPQKNSIFMVRVVASSGTGFDYGPSNMANVLSDQHWISYANGRKVGTATIQETACPYEMLTPSDAMAIDGKVDDGDPANGIVRANARTNTVGGDGQPATNCLTDLNNASGVKYATSKNGESCMMFFYLGYQSNLDS